MSDYKFIKIDDSSYSKIQELYLRSFDLKATEEEVKIKYDTSAFGYKNLGYLAVHNDGDLAAYYGAFPMRMHIQDKDYLVAQSGDTMTAPEHRKKGLFTILAKACYKLAEESGFACIFGFPNANSYPGFAKNLDWKFYGTMKNFTITNNVLFPLCELSAKYKNLHDFYSNYCKRKLKKYKIELKKENVDVFNDENAKAYIKKDVDFFKYKLNNKNIHLIKINNFTLLIKPEPHLLIGTVGKFEENMLDEFLKTLKCLAHKLGCKKTIITLSENHWLYAYLKTKMAFQDSLPIGYYEIDKSIPYADISYTGADYDTF